MDWKDWKDRRIFLRTKQGKVYSGIVKEIADIGDGIIFISLIDRYDNWVTVSIAEIIEIKEEKENE